MYRLKILECGKSVDEKLELSLYYIPFEKFEGWLADKRQALLHALVEVGRFFLDRPS